MNKEIEFAKTLEKVRKQANLQGGFIEKRQVEEAFLALELSQQQLQLVFDYLEKHKIGIDKEVDVDAFLSADESVYLDEYLQSLSVFETVTDGQKQAYILSAMAGDTGAQEKLVEIYLPKVAEIAKLYVDQGVYLEDLIGQGNMALSEGVTMLGSQENADEGEGLLVRMIMDSMEELIQMNLEATRTDQKIADEVNQLAEKARELAEEMRRKVTIQELSEETGIEQDKILEIYKMSGYAIEDIDGGAS